MHQQAGTPLYKRHGARRMLSFLLAVISVFSLLTFAPALAEETGTVNATSLYVRKEPSTDADKLRSLVNGDKVEVLATEGDWYKVRYGVVVGYCAKQYITVGGGSSSGSSSSSSSGSSSSSSTAGKTIASLGDAPKATKPGDNNKSVEKLQEALTIAGYYSGRISGNYGDLTEEAVKAFQKAKGLSVDGIAGNGTIKALFGTSAAGSTLKTEKPNWFDGGDTLIPNGAVFTVKDVKTGETFKAKRWSGVNHLDAEPYSEEDAKIIKKLYGGSWSWSRRPILIKYGDHVYAASMNGMPHGTQTIKNNGFEGHFCIHFYKSKTHGSDKVDDEHQKAVNTAAKYAW